MKIYVNSEILVTEILSSKVLVTKFNQINIQIKLRPVIAELIVLKILFSLT